MLSNVNALYTFMQETVLTNSLLLYIYIPRIDSFGVFFFPFLFFFLFLRNIDFLCFVFNFETKTNFYEKQLVKHTYFDELFICLINTVLLIFFYLLKNFHPSCSSVLPIPSCLLLSLVCYLSSCLFFK